MPVFARSLASLVAMLTLVSFVLLETVQAQGMPPAPPATIYGSINDAAGEVPEGELVEALVNDNVCGTTETVYAGEGDAQVTMYVIRVVAEQQTEGCGAEGDEIRIRVGGRLADQSIPWENSDLLHLDIVFGDITPAPIPTTTPTPEGAEPTQAPDSEPTSAAPGSTDGSPEDPADETPDGEDGETPDGETSPESTEEPEGQLTDATPGAGASAGDGDGSGDGGFPVWAILLLVIGGVAVVGGGVGFVMARNKSQAGDDGTVEDDFDVTGDGAESDRLS